MHLRQVLVVVTLSRSCSIFRKGTNFMLTFLESLLRDDVSKCLFVNLLSFSM